MAAILSRPQCVKQTFGWLSHEFLQCFLTGYNTLFTCHKTGKEVSRLNPTKIPHHKVKDRVIANTREKELTFVMKPQIPLMIFMLKEMKKELKKLSSDVTYWYKMHWYLNPSKSWTQIGTIMWTFTDFDYFPLLFMTLLIIYLTLTS